MYCRNALHQLPDFWKVVALGRVAGWLAPDRVLLQRNLVDDTFAAWFDRAVADPAAGDAADDFSEHVRTEHSTFTWLLEPMLEHTGFTIVDREVRAGVYASDTCVRVVPGTTCT